MRIASYNVENLFNRAKVMNLEDWDAGKAILADYAELSALFGKLTYSDADKARMVALLKQLGLERSDDAPFVILRRNRGHLLKRPTAGGIEILASGRTDWIGSIDLKPEPIREVAVHNTARVIAAVNADIQALVEAESRPALLQFNDDFIPAVGGTRFGATMLIDGNDARGIDVGLYLKAGYTLDIMRSHVDDRDAGGSLIFSRDCPEYRIVTPSGAVIWLLINHLKSKGFGSQAANDARRKLQAERVAAIYKALVASGETNIAVVGDMNDFPTSPPMQPLLAEGSLKDISEHPAFDDGGFPGTFIPCKPKDKIDYILLSPALYSKVTAGGIERRGAWPGVRPRKWATFPELAKEADAASDHCAIWADVNL